MKAESLYIQKLTYDENTGNEIIGLFPSESNPAIVSSYTYDAKRMGGAPTLTATIYSSEPLQWKKEEFVEYNGDRFFASYTPNSTKDNSSRMWKSEITFTSRRELLDNTLFFDVVVDDVDTQNKDRYRSNQTKFTFGGTIHEFVARINSSMAYCGLYRPTDVYKGYYVVVDEGYGTEEVKEVSFEDQYLTDVLQLINTTFELDYYWDGNVCHVGKVQHDLTDTPIKYGSSDALISVSKENANYKIVDMITGYGSSDNLPYYYPNDDEFGEAVFNTENISKDKVSVDLSKFLKGSKYNDVLVLYKSKYGQKYSASIDSSLFGLTRNTEPENLTLADSQTNPTVTCSFGFSFYVKLIKGQILDFTKLSFKFSMLDSLTHKDNITEITAAYKDIYLSNGNDIITITKKTVFGDNCKYPCENDGEYKLTIWAEFSYRCRVFRNGNGVTDYYGANSWNASFSGNIELLYEPTSEYEWKNGDKYIPYDESGINIREISGANCIEYDYQFFKDDNRYGFNKVYSGTDDNATKVVVTDRVWIAPSSVLMPSIYRNTKGAERFFYALNNTHKLPSGSGYYEFVNLYKKGNPHQGTVTFDDIKPTINGIVNAEGQLFGEIADVAFDKEDSDVKDSDGNYIHSYFYIKLHKFNGDFGFDLFAHALASESAKINLIKSNGCPACSFVIYNKPSADNSKYYNCVSVDENGNLKQVRTDKNDYIFANASDAYEDKLNQDSTQKELWIAVQKDTSTLGIVMPNASAGFKPQKGDLFVITGIKPPKVLVTAAEKRLDDALVKNMSENNTDQFNYSVKFSRIFLQENPDFASKLNENAKLSIQIQGDYDNDGNLISHKVFVSNYSVKVDNDELAEVEIELVNSLEVTKSDTKQIIDAVKGEAVKSLSSIVGSSNANSFNASIADKMYLSKLNDDTAKGTITWEKIQKLVSGLHVGNSNNENGGSWTTDAEGRSHLITDYLEVRMKAIFEELVVKKTSTIGGKEIISPAGGVVAHKVEEVTVTYNNVSQKAYRCYFLAEQDGDAVDNDFAVNDQVRSESFNVRKDTYHKAGNHFYWRLAIGRDEEPVELEGKKYHYIDLSDTDCATASDVPAKGDVLNQCGNRTDVERQNCLIFSAVDTYSPSISLYHGINSYSFANREYVEYGVNKQTNKAFFHVYGDMYFGDRPTSANNYEGDSYVKYDSDKKKVTIKGDLDIKSTYDGKTLDKYITEKSLDKDDVETIIKKSETIVDLKKQIDGAIETWFYDGEPTLKTEPAIGWTTDTDKKTHLGDLYYDNKTGKAYRFAKDGSTYTWIIITDTELTKALEDSSQALKDTKSKRRIFGSQPVPPYDVNDMWVNATYPSDGSTYKNEILKCSTSKAEGEEFDIADWKLASKYTDDTKAEEAKKAAEKAQAEIKNTQTNLIDLGKTVSNNKKAFDAFTSDGYLDSSEIAAIAQDSKRLEDDYNAAVESYNNVVGSKFLLDKDGNDTTYKTDLVSAKATLDSAKNELITYLSDIVGRYNASDSEGKATIKAAAARKYTNFTNAYKAFYDKLGVANNYITSNLFDGLNTKLITNMAGLEYIKAALVDGRNTEIKGGLVLTTLIALRNEKGDVTSGINGANVKDDGIALWLGGKAIDRQASTTKEDEMDSAAKALLRFDGTGYFANGNLWWDADGTLHADPTSFIINKNNVGVQLALFAPVWKSGTTDTTKLANVLSIDPQKPFTHLNVSGNVTTEGSLKIGGIYLSYDSANNALRLSKDAAGKEAANFYALGGITAYGKGAGTSGGGGGLNGSVKSYSNALKLTSESLNEIASAYSIKALDSRISSLEGGSATAISVSGSGNAVTSVTKDGTTISVVKGSTFSLSGHTHKWADITDRPSSLKNPSALSWSGYSSGSYDGSAAKSISIPNNTNQLTNGAGFITASASITGNAATATRVNHSLSVFGKSFNGSADVTVADTDLITSISTATANLTDKTEILTSCASDNGFNDSNAKNRIYRRPASAIWGYINSKTISNADKLDNVHLNGIFTALSNTNNGVSMTIGTVAKSLANMQVYSATKLVTARNIALNGDLMGNANFDGSANITIYGYMSYCNAIVNNTNTYPWRRIAKVNEITGNYSDGCILLYISEGFNGGYYGIARVCIKTDNLSTGANASCSIQWISRNGYGLDSLKIAMYKTTGKAYYDVFFKMRNAYASVVIRTLQDQRGGLGKRFILVNSTEASNAASHTEAYATIEDAATAIHNQAYTSIAQGSDVATVRNADMVDGIHASGLFTNLSNSGNSLSITVGGTNKTLTVNYASNAGNADTLDGVHASGLFTNLSNSGNNISITIGGTNKTLTAAYATNCDTVDGYHAQSGSSKPYGKIPVIGTDGVIELGHYIDFHHDNTTGSNYSVRLQTNGNHSNVVTLPTATGTLALTSDNVASATKLQTARTIWGQSFNGTGNVSGALSGATTISASNTISTTLQNGALKIGNKSAPISAIDAQVIFNTGAAIRFGETNWDWNQWAGLKYNHSKKTIYLGIADGSVFNANSAQTGGSLYFPAINDVYCYRSFNIVGGSANINGTIYNYYTTYGKNSITCGFGVMAPSNTIYLNDNNGIRLSSYAGVSLDANTGHDIILNASAGSVTINSNNSVALKVNGNLLATGGITAYSSSDIRLKQDLRKLDYLGIIKAMGGTFGFAWKKDNTRSIGWIAQHVLCNPHLKDIVETDEKGYYKINYWSPKLIATAFGAIEQVDDEVTRLKKKVKTLENRVKKLEIK